MTYRTPVMEPHAVDIKKALSLLERYANSGATCPSCGSTNTHTVRVESGGVVVRTYFECGSCGNVW